MSTFVQLLLVIVISTLTFLITFAAIQVFQILFEFKQTLKKINEVLNHTQTLSASAAKPITAVNDFFSEVKGLVDETQEEIISATPDRVITPKEEVQTHPVTHIKDMSRRFFRRSGLPLRSSN